jgi:gas vesicle protein
MSEDTAPRTSSRLLCFVVGLGVGTLITALFVPKSGDEIRDYLAAKANELKGRAAKAVEQGRNRVAQKKQQITTAVDAGREVYKQEIAKGAGAGTKR